MDKTITVPIEIICPCCRGKLGIAPLAEGYEIRNLDEWNNKTPSFFSIAQKWANDWFTIALRFRTKERLAQQIISAMMEAR